MSDTGKKKIETVGDRIKKLRKSKGDLQKDLAIALNKSESAVRMWELGKSEPDIETLKLIAAKYSVSVSYLVNDGIFGMQKDPSAGFLTLEELNLVAAYRSHPEMKDAVNKLLGLSEEGMIQVYAAAESDRTVLDGTALIDEKRWKAIKEIPPTDEDLL